MAALMLSVPPLCSTTRRGESTVIWPMCIGVARSSTVSDFDVNVSHFEHSRGCLKTLWRGETQLLELYITTEDGDMGGVQSCGEVSGHGGLCLDNVPGDRVQPEYDDGEDDYDDYGDGDEGKFDGHFHEDPFLSMRAFLQMAALK